MNNFKSQSAMTASTYERTDGNKEQMIEMVAKLLKENPYLLKPHKLEELEAKGDKGYIAYAKVKVREHFNRTMKRKPKADKPAETKSTVSELVESEPFKLGGDVNGTSFHGDYFNANYQDLVQAFGPIGENYSDKVSAAWEFSDSKGNCFTLYDWKETNMYDEGLPSVTEHHARPSIEFHIGYDDEGTGNVSEFKSWLRSKITTPATDNLLRANFR